MVNYTTDILPLEESGKTDAEIVGILSTLYRKDAKATGSSNLRVDPDLLHILGGQAKMIRIGVDATWKGPLIDYMSSLDTAVPQNQQLLAGFELLLSQLQISNRMVHTSTNMETAFLTTTITTIVKGLLDQWAVASPSTVPMTSAELQAEVDKATGGIVWPEASEAEIATLRQAHADQEARVAAYQQVNTKTGLAVTAAEAAMNAGQTPAEILAAAEAAWNA